MKLTIKQVEELPEIKYANSYSRLSAVLDLWEDPRVSPSTFYKLLGRQWSVCDDISAHSEAIYRALAEGAPEEFIRRHMMTKKEHAVYDALPETITMFRGCGSHNEQGWCWSLDRKTAEVFPQLLRYRVEDPRILTGTISKDYVCAVKLDREETEVIVNPDDVQIVSREPLEASTVLT